MFTTCGTDAKVEFLKGVGGNDPRLTVINYRTQGEYLFTPSSVLRPAARVHARPEEHRYGHVPPPPPHRRNGRAFERHKDSDVCGGRDRVAIATKRGKQVVLTSCTDFAEEVKKSGEGVDLIIDFVGKDYFHRNLEILNRDGAVVYLSFLSGANVDKVPLATLLYKRLTLKGSTLRSRTVEYQAKLLDSFKNDALPLIVDGKMKVEVHDVGENRLATLLTHSGVPMDQGPGRSEGHGRQQEQWQGGFQKQLKMCLPIPDCVRSYPCCLGVCSCMNLLCRSSRRLPSEHRAPSSPVSSTVLPSLLRSVFPPLHLVDLPSCHSLIARSLTHPIYCIHRARHVKQRGRASPQAWPRARPRTRRPTICPRPILRYQL